MEQVNSLINSYAYDYFKSFYIVGSNSAETSFKVIKVDRTGDPKILNLSEDLVIYVRKTFSFCVHKMRVS